MYTKAYVSIHPIVNKHFTKASVERTLKVFRANPFTNKFKFIVS